MKEKLDPYAALRFREFNFFLVIRFILVFGWSMQFIIVEWEVYSLTKDPLSLGLIGLAEVIPAISTALFAGHIVDQREKKMLFVQCITAFLLVAIGYYFITSPYAYENYENSEILIGIYILVFIGGFVRAFIGPTIFSLVALIVPKRVYPNAATWSSSTWQLAVVLGPAFAGFSIAWIGVHNSMAIVLGAIIIGLFLIGFIKKKPILNPKIGEPIFQSLKAGLNFNSSADLDNISLDLPSIDEAKNAVNGFNIGVYGQIKLAMLYVRPEIHFSKFETWYKRKWPLHLLEDTVEELTNFYLKKIEKYGKDHFKDFRNSTQYFRLKMLQQKNSNPRTKLF